MKKQKTELKRKDTVSDTYLMELLMDVSDDARNAYFGHLKDWKAKKGWSKKYAMEQKREHEAVLVGTEFGKIAGGRLDVSRKAIETMKDFDDAWWSKNEGDIMIMMRNALASEHVKSLKQQDDNANRQDLQKFTLDGAVWNVDVSDWKYLYLNLDGFYKRVLSILRPNGNGVDGMQALYDRDRGEWLIWTGQRWDRTKPDEFYEIQDQLVEVYTKREMVQRFNSEKDLMKFLNQLSNPRIFMNVIERLKSTRALGVSGLKTDQRYDLLNVENGVINLKTGELLKPQKSYLMTKQAAVKYNPQAPEPKTWIKFLKTTFKNDKDILPWIQLPFSYLLLGDNPQQLLFLFYGPSARNGKTTAITILSRILGADEDASRAYTRQEDVNILMANTSRSGNGPSPALAQSENNRLMVLSEPKATDVLDSGLIKSFTGDGQVSAREAYQNTKNFKPTAKPLIASNWLPRHDGDAGVMRRFLLIPFNHHIASYSLDDDPKINDRLWSEREEILKWLVDGCVKLHNIQEDREKQKGQIRKQIEEGKIVRNVPKIYSSPLQPYPASVTKAWKQYAYGSNSASLFIEDVLLSKQEYWNYLCQNIFDFNRRYEWKDRDRMYKEQFLVADPYGYCRKKDLYKLYKAWCEDSGIRQPFTSQNFNRKVERLLIPSKVNGQACYLGVVITQGPKSYRLPDVKNTYMFSIKRIQRQINNQNVSLYELYRELTPDQGYKTRLSDTQSQKIYDELKTQEMFYCGKMTETLKGYDPRNVKDPYPADGPDDHRKPDPEPVNLEEMFEKPGTTVEDVKDEDFK